MEPTRPASSPIRDLSTESRDPDELLALLATARERLSFYESFDRVIAENVKRTSDLMAEALAMREEAATNAGSTSQNDALIAEIAQELTDLRNAFDQVAAKVALLLHDDRDPIADDTLVLREPGGTLAAPELSDTVADLVTINTEPESHPDEPSPEPQTDRQTDVIAHGVNSAVTAIQLQEHLRSLDGVSNVEPREFADGELRLDVRTTGSLDTASLGQWLAKHHGRLVSESDKAIELTFS